MKKFTSAVLVLIISMLFSVSSFANFFNVMIDDSASLFTEEEIEFIDASAYEFALENNFSVAVVTTDNAMGKSAMEYADDYYDSLIFGSGWSEDGMVFLIDMDNREIYVSCAGLCVDEYSDYELDSIIDRGYDCVVNEEYFKCIISMIDEANFLMSGGNSDDFVETGIYWTDTVGEEIYYDEYYDGSSVKNKFEISHVFIYIVVGLVAGAITVFIIYSQYKNTGKGDEFNAEDISLELTTSTDNIISKNVITTKIPKNNNNHRSGGGGGGVSVHRSSGGVRHSGAGRKF